MTEMSHRVVFGASFVAFGFGLWFAVMGGNLPPGNAAIPTSIACNLTGAIGSIAGLAIQNLSARIDKLEQRSTTPKTGDA